MEQMAMGDELRDDALERVDDHADELWREKADEALVAVARMQRYLTSEDVLAYLSMRYPHLETHDMRALGPVMIRGRSAGVIVPTDRFVKSRRPGRHSGPVRMWSSLLYDEVSYRSVAP